MNFLESLDVFFQDNRLQSPQLLAQNFYFKLQCKIKFIIKLTYFYCCE